MPAIPTPLDTSGISHFPSVDFSLQFFVDGPPIPMPRARSPWRGKKPRRDARADLWQQSIRDAAQGALRTIQDPEAQIQALISPDGFFGGAALEVDLDFLFEQARTSKRDRPTNKYDLDNLAKAVWDALGNWKREGCVLWRDDGQICASQLIKRFAGPTEGPGVGVTVRVLP